MDRRIDCPSVDGSPTAHNAPAPKQPFIDPTDGAALHALFPPRYYAIAVPTVLLAAFVGLVACFIGWTMLKAAAANRAKQQAKKKKG